MTGGHERREKMKYLTTLVGLMAVAVAAFAVASPASGGAPANSGFWSELL